MVDYSFGFLTAFLTSFHELLHWAVHRFSIPDQFARWVDLSSPLFWAIEQRDGKLFLPFSKLEQLMDEGVWRPREREDQQREDQLEKEAEALAETEEWLEEDKES
jgi:hypothetical protein